MKKKAVLEKLAGGLRDLHVELTVRKDEDHGALLSAVSNMLDGIAAETEVEQAMVEATVPAPASKTETTEDFERKRNAQRQDTQKERH